VVSFGILGQLPFPVTNRVFDSSTDYKITQRSSKFFEILY